MSEVSQDQPAGLVVNYAELATKHNAAFAAFSTIHEARNPKPVLEAVRPDRVSQIITVILAIVMIAAVVVSSSRTVDEFGGGLIGLLAFVMIEGGIMAYAFFTARRRVSKERDERIKRTLRLATSGLVLTFIVGLGANIDSTLKAHSIMIAAEVKTVINLLVAISAPTLAFISSDVLAIELMAQAFKRDEVLNAYNAAMSAWHDSLNRAWGSKQAQWGVKVDLAPEPAQLPAVNSSNLMNSYQISRNRPSPRLQKALDYLTEHPEHLETASRELESVIGVSYGTINKAQIALRRNGND